MGYLGNGLTITGTQNSKRIVVDATPNQTISTVTGGYLIGQLDVYRNGVKLVDTQDYTASDGASVTFLSAASEGDELEFVVFENFDVANALSSSGGTVSGDLVVTGIATFNSDVSIGGTLTYEDVTNIDSVGIITARSYVSIADSIVHTGDENTSIRFPAADTFTVETAGTERLRVDSSGNVAIGTVTPTRPLAIQSDSSTAFAIQADSDNTLRLQMGYDYSNDYARIASEDVGVNQKDLFQHAMNHRWGRNGSTEYMRVDSSGNVGIGTTNPDNLLHLSGNLSRIEIQDTAGTGNAARPGVIMTDSAGSNLFFIGNGGVGHSDLTFTNYQTDDIEFRTQNIERLRITSAGLVGIGTDNPTSILDVEVGTNTGINFTNIGTAPIIDFKANSVESAGRIRINEASGGGVLQFATKTTGGTVTEAFRVDTSQRLVIGADSVPTVNSIQSRLSVSGDSFANSAYSAVRYEDGANGASIILAHARGTEASPSSVNSLDEVGKIRFIGHDGTDFAHNFAEIRAHADGTVAGNDCPGRISFWTTEDGGTTSTERLRIGSNGQWGLAGANYGTSGQAIVSNGSGSPPTWQDVASGISTHVGTASGIVTSIFLGDATDHKVTVTGFVTFTATQAGTEGESHTIRIVNSGIATVGFSTYFLFPSGAAPDLPTADGAVSLISFTVHDSVGAGCTQLLAGASLNFS